MPRCVGDHTFLTSSPEGEIESYDFFLLSIFYLLQARLCSYAHSKMDLSTIIPYI